MNCFSFIVFDLDGTLIDSYRALTTAMNRLGIDRSGGPWRLDEVRNLVGEGVEVFLQRALGAEIVNEELIRRFETHYAEVCCGESDLLAGVDATLRALAARGIAMAVCTNKPTRFSRTILEHFDLLRLFSAVVGPDLAGCRKPDPRHLLFTLDEIGADPEESLFVGDMPIDVATARGCGVAVAVLATGSSTLEELRASGPDYLIAAFPDLIRLVAPELQAAL